MQSPATAGLCFIEGTIGCCLLTQSPERRLRFGFSGAGAGGTTLVLSLPPRSLDQKPRLGAAASTGTGFFAGSRSRAGRSERREAGACEPGFESDCRFLGWDWERPC